MLTNAFLSVVACASGPCAATQPGSLVSFCVQPFVISSLAHWAKSSSAVTEACQAPVRSWSIGAGSADAPGMVASSVSKVRREPAALSKTCGSWFRDGPQASTSLTAWVMAVRSETLCESIPPRLCAACCSVTSAAVEGPVGGTDCAETGADVAAAALACADRCVEFAALLTVSL
jgi:hypothetical protein